MTIFTEISGSHSNDYEDYCCCRRCGTRILEQQKCTDISVKPTGSIIRVNDVCNRFVWNVGTLLPDHMANISQKTAILKSMHSYG